MANSDGGRWALGSSLNSQGGARNLGYRHVLMAFILVAAFVARARSASAAGCPTEPDWSYTYPNGPQQWNQLFPYQCGQGSRQSPFNIVSGQFSRTLLPKLRFFYNVADVTYLDHDDQVQLDHGEGNYITIGGRRYDLINVHVHTPSEYTIDGQQFPMEIHFVHQDSVTGQLAVVGVMVAVGNADPGVIDPPSYDDPSLVDLKLTDLLPKRKNYVRFNGSLTTPGNTTALPRCAEGVLWTEMLAPISMSADQIAAFEDSARACWGTSVTNRSLQPINGRFLLVQF
jgi:carbonic anhydrase